MNYNDFVMDNEVVFRKRNGEPTADWAVADVVFYHLDQEKPIHAIKHLVDCYSNLSLIAAKRIVDSVRGEDYYPLGGRPNTKDIPVRERAYLELYGACKALALLDRYPRLEDK